MKKVYQGNYIEVFHEKIGDLTYERVRLLPAVQVIPFIDGKILMIKEKRVEEGRTRWKFVSGFMDKEGLSAEQIAQEELMEEAGYKAGKLVKYHHLEDKHTFILPITYFLAYDLKEESIPNPDSNVIEEVKAFTIDELYERTINGEFDFLHEASIIMKLYRDIKEGKITV